MSTLNRWRESTGSTGLSNPCRGRGDELTDYELSLRNGCFSLTKTEKHADGDGDVSWTVHGSYTSDEGEPVLNCETIEQESWLSDDEAEGEAFVEPCEDMIVAIVQENVITCTAFEQSLTLECPK